MMELLSPHQKERLERLCADAIETWGVLPQLMQAEEECLELALEIHKVHRGRDDSKEIMKEVVDVYQCIHQLIWMIGEDKFRAAFDEKMDKFEAHLENSKAKRNGN